MALSDKDERETTPLCERATAMLKLFRQGKWFSRPQLSVELDLDLKQVTRTMTNLKEKGHAFSRRPLRGGRLHEYQLDSSAIGATTSAKTENQRLLVEMNRIRRIAEETGHRDIQTVAERCLMASGNYIG